MERAHERLLEVAHVGAQPRHVHRRAPALREATLLREDVAEGAGAVDDDQVGIPGQLAREP